MNQSFSLMLQVLTPSDRLKIPIQSQLRITLASIRSLLASRRERHYELRITNYKLVPMCFSKIFSTLGL